MIPPGRRDAPAGVSGRYHASLAPPAGPRGAPPPPPPTGASPLLTSAAFRRYWLGRLASYAGDQVARTALLIAVYDRAGGAAVGLLLLVSTAPRLLGPVLGAVADRVDQRRLMIACDLGQAALYTVLALTLPALPGVLMITALGTCLATLFTPAGRCLVPRLVGMDDLPRANASLAVAVNVGIAAGPALGGVLLAVAGLRSTLLVNALSFVISAVLLSGRAIAAASGSAGTDRAAAQAPSLPDVLRSGVGMVWRHRVVRAVALMMLVGVAFAALDNVAVVPYGVSDLHASPGMIGALGTAYGIGMAIAPLALTVRGRFRPDLVLDVALLGFAAGTLLTGAYPLFGLALAGQALAGAGNGWQNVANDTLIQQHVPAARLGTVFGTVYTFPYAAEVLAYAVGGPLLAATAPRWVLVIAGTGVLVTFAVGAPALARALHGTRPGPGTAAVADAAGPTG